MIALISENELEWTFFPSCGKGGQHANKVSTGVKLSFDVRNSHSLSETDREKILQFLIRSGNVEGIVVVKSTKTRSQASNREDALKKLLEILNKGLQTRKKRKKTKPGKAAKQKRLDSKKKRSEIKQGRKKIN
jgi:ribosome-associated protein